MFCRACGAHVVAGAPTCSQCGQPPFSGGNYCHNCGNPTLPGSVTCVRCGTSFTGPAGVGATSSQASNKVPAGICGILLGSLGVHKFVLGYNTEGIIMLLATVLTCGVGAGIMGIIGLVEGIIYLTKTDTDFVNTYVTNKKGWF
jgi:TM2 domain-containing membrane protein YozV